jgi:glycosyltransferase involved in cell wall biosynthesis
VVLNHRDPAEWAGVLRELAQDEGRRAELAQRARVRHQRDYSLEQMIERYAQLYLTLCRGEDSQRS